MGIIVICYVDMLRWTWCQLDESVGLFLSVCSDPADRSGVTYMAMTFAGTLSKQAGVRYARVYCNYTAP